MKTLMATAGACTVEPVKSRTCRALASRVACSSVARGAPCRPSVELERCRAAAEVEVQGALASR